MADTKSYLTCTNCGQKALSVATRCPHCGRPFDSRPFRYTTTRPRRSWIPLALLITVGAVILLVVNRLRPRFGVAPSAGPSAAAIAPTAESLPAVPSPPPEAPRHSQPPTRDSAKSVAPTPTPRPVAPTPAPQPVALTPTPQPVDAGAVQRRYANTWMNVRADRSNTAPVVRVLRPGEEVQVDLLKQGWYRVVSDSQALGYADQRYLDTMPPADVSH